VSVSCKDGRSTLDNAAANGQVSRPILIHLLMKGALTPSSSPHHVVSGHRDILGRFIYESNLDKPEVVAAARILCENGMIPSLLSLIDILDMTFDVIRLWIPIFIECCGLDIDQRIVQPLVPLDYKQRAIYKIGDWIDVNNIRYEDTTPILLPKSKVWLPNHRCKNASKRVQLLKPCRILNMTLAMDGTIIYFVRPKYCDGEDEWIRQVHHSILLSLSIHLSSRNICACLCRIVRVSYARMMGFLCL
jgi:hypothetical protein